MNVYSMAQPPCRTERPTRFASDMKIQINCEEREFETSSAPFTLSALVEQLGMKSDRVAIELNREIVPRDRWAETKLADGDRLEIVHFVGGGK